MGTPVYGSVGQYRGNAFRGSVKKLSHGVQTHTGRKIDSAPWQHSQATQKILLSTIADVVGSPATCNHLKHGYINWTRGMWTLRWAGLHTCSSSGSLALITTSRTQANKHKENCHDWGTIVWLNSSWHDDLLNRATTSNAVLRLVWYFCIMGLHLRITCLQVPSAVVSKEPSKQLSRHFFPNDSRIKNYDPRAERHILCIHFMVSSRLPFR